MIPARLEEKKLATSRQKIVFVVKNKLKYRW